MLTQGFNLNGKLQNIFSLRFTSWDHVFALALFRHWDIFVRFFPLCLDEDTLFVSVHQKCTFLGSLPSSVFLLSSKHMMAICKLCKYIPYPQLTVFV